MLSCLRRNAVVIGLLLAAALLRLAFLEHMEFKLDEVASIGLGMSLLADRPWATPSSWPAVGLMSSGGIFNPPLYNYIMALFWWLTRDALVSTALVALINWLSLIPIYAWAKRAMSEDRARLLLGWFCLSPVAVLYSRKLWPPELLAPAVAAMLWGVYFVRNGRFCRGLLLLMVASVGISQLHLAGPILLAALAISLAIAWRCDAKAGAPWRFERPSALEATGLAAALFALVFFTWPYLKYLIDLPPSSFSSGMRLAWAEPQLLQRLARAVVPLEMQDHFEPHFSLFLREPTPGAWAPLVRRATFTGAAFTGVPLALVGAYGWLRRPHAQPVLGIAWWIFVVLFSLLHLVAFPQYVLVLSPLPALLMAGGFDGEAEPSLATKWLHRLRWTHLALLGVLTLTTLHWLAARGGADGDYGVGYATRLQQAREIVSMAERGVEPGKLKPVESLPTQCHPPELVTVWLSIQLDPRSHGFLESVRVCESWVESDGRAELRWEVIAVQ